MMRRKVKKYVHTAKKGQEGAGHPQMEILPNISIFDISAAIHSPKWLFAPSSPSTRPFGTLQLNERVRRRRRRSRNVPRPRTAGFMCLWTINDAWSARASGAMRG